MNAYPDTSFLCALYRRQDNTNRALAYRQAMDEPLQLTRLLLWEFRQSARFQAFRHSKNPQDGFPMREAERMVAKLAEHINSNAARVVAVDLVSILVTAERISKSRTFLGGHRSFDILHVATALELQAKAFLSFDANQIQLATAEGLEVPLVEAA